MTLLITAQTFHTQTILQTPWSLQIVEQENSLRAANSGEQRVGCLRPTSLTIQHGNGPWVLTSALETRRVKSLCENVQELTLASSCLDLSGAKVRGWHALQ